MANAELLVEVVSDLDPTGVRQCWVHLPLESTVADALRASGFADPAVHSGDPSGSTWLLGCWGKRCDLSTVLRERDRVELYRPLVVQPMDPARHGPGRLC